MNTIMDNLNFLYNVNYINNIAHTYIIWKIKMIFINCIFLISIKIVFK